MSDSDRDICKLRAQVQWIIGGFSLNVAVALADHGVADLKQLSDVEWAALLLLDEMGEAGVKAMDKLLSRVFRQQLG